MDKMIAESLFQTPEERESGTVTFRIFIDGAWRNIQGEASWKKLSQKELFAKLHEVYFTPR